MATHNVHDPTAEDVELQLQNIRDEVTVHPLLSEPERLSLACQLAREYQNDATYYQQVLSLFEASREVVNKSGPVYKTIRYARRDGNCFFRCASYRLYEHMLTDREYAAYCRGQIEHVKPRMLSLFGEYASDFSDVAEEVLERITSGAISTAAELARAVLSDDASYLIVFFRYAVSVYLRDHAEDFLPFVMGLDYPTVEAYCASEVEPVDHESDNVQLVGFAKLFNLLVVVETLDRTVSAARTTHRINAAKDAEGNEIGATQHALTLLFRPGHYDLLES